MVAVYLPTAFSKKIGKNYLKVEPGTLFSCLQQICQQYPILQDLVLLNDQMVPFIKVFINKVDSNKLSGLFTDVQANDQVHIIVAVAGG